MASLSLPRIVHPSSAKETSGTHLQSCLRTKGVYPQSSVRDRTKGTCVKGSRQRPRSCPEGAGSHQGQGEGLLKVLTQRVCRGHGSVFKQAFRAFDVKGEGKVTREGLYRILCNIMSGVSRKDFNQLLSQLHLESLKAISFEQFYSRLSGSNTLPRPKTTYLPLRRECGGLNDTVERVLKRCKRVDSFKSGKLTMDQLRSVFREFELPITPEQITQLCSELGYREGQLVSYTHLLSHFTAKDKSGLVHSKLTDKQQRFHSYEPKRACTSVGDAQTRLVTLLNSQFLKLLSAFKTEDRRASGYVSRSVFQSVLESFSQNNSDVAQVTESLSDDSEWVPYPKFLAMFEDAPTPRADPPPTPQEQPPNTGQLVRSIRELVSARGVEVMEVFESLDPANTGRLTVGVARELLERFDVQCSRVELEWVWRRLLKNKDSTVQFQEFIRQFTSKQASVEGRHLTEDHCFMMSKNLHRDEDMILASIRSKLRYHQSILLWHLSQLDTLKTGYLPKPAFLECVLRVCPEVSPGELSRLRAALGEKVEYGQLLSIAQHNPYRHGSNMSCVLAQESPSCFEHPNSPSVLTAHPPSGLSGIKAHLQKQLAKNWRVIRRLFREMDKSRCGCVSVGEFWTVLGECGVELCSEDKFHILEFLDPTLGGTVDYRHFINALFEQ